ncbi:AI-2E family transporter [Glutamicibacter sp.]|nr:AI-2E family transporter [Glutamicibacter sp.]HJX80010.1 AI-2E family transporter [Glutamicibacter sp.]
MAYFKKLWASPHGSPSEGNESRVEVHSYEQDYAPDITELWTDLMGRMAIRGLQVLFIGLVVVCVMLGLLRVTTIVIPILIATILACALWPIVTRLRRHLSALLTAWTVFLGALIILGGIGTGLVYSVINQWDELVGQAQKGFAQLSGAGQQLVERLPFGISQQDLESAGQSVSKMVSSSQLGSNAIHTLGAAGETLTGTILILVVLFFFLKDGDRIWAFIISWIPTRYRNKWIASGEQALHTFGGYIRGTAIVAAVDTVGIVAVLLILRIPLALPLGVLVFFGSFIPIVGATVVGALAVLVALVTNGPVSALIVLAAVIVVNQLEGHFLQPVVMAHTLKLHALVVLLALAIGTALGGIVGAVLAVPLTAVGWAITKVWAERDGVTAVEKMQDEIANAPEVEASPSSTPASSEDQ